METRRTMELFMMWANDRRSLRYLINDIRDVMQPTGMREQLPKNVGRHPSYH